jgi:hypothetical protein
MSESEVSAILASTSEPAAEVAAETESAESNESASEGGDQSNLSEPSSSESESSEAAANFAAISRREKAILERESLIKEQESKFSKYGELEAQIEENPLAVLEHYGISLDDILLSSLGDDAPEPTTDDRISSLSAEIEAMKQAKIDEAARIKAKEEELAQNTIDEAISNHKNSIATTISENADKYELINQLDAGDMVWEVTQAHYDNTGIILSIDEAADKVEEYYSNQVKKAMGLSKFQQQNEAPVRRAEEEIKESIVAQHGDRSAPRPTLTQNYLTRNPTKKVSTSVSLTAEESKRLAAKKLDELWKKQRN